MQQRYGGAMGLHQAETPARLPRVSARPRGGAVRCDANTVGAGGGHVRLRPGMTRTQGGGSLIAGCSPGLPCTHPPNRDPPRPPRVARNAVTVGGGHHRDRPRPAVRSIVSRCITSPGSDGLPNMTLLHPHKQVDMVKLPAVRTPAQAKHPCAQATLRPVGTTVPQEPGRV